MAKGYSKDFRERAVAMVEEGESRALLPDPRLCMIAPARTMRPKPTAVKRANPAP